MSFSSDRYDKVHALLVKLETQLRVGHVDMLTFDFVDFETSDTRPVVDANGDYVLLANLTLKFLVYEKTIVEDTIKGLRDAAAQLKRVEIDMDVEVEAAVKGGAI